VSKSICVHERSYTRLSDQGLADANAGVHGGFGTGYAFFGWRAFAHAPPWMGLLLRQKTDAGFQIFYHLFELRIQDVFLGKAGGIPL
jgi:hypothetical protein